ncbi:hypothetical protein Y032_0050g1947 [Ancylostoma ceylanicum]|uniref:Uncharacterized protein n=1 Tax=Ancylostoma ceylanicum TaxID=53326 RepID=A0A016U9B5_9BILA|nr:hypothetical protein Y032_0050g1947 [Ancylostoma ceylanicum]
MAAPPHRTYIPLVAWLSVSGAATHGLHLITRLNITVTCRRVCCSELFIFSSSPFTPSETEDIGHSTRAIIQMRYSVV